MNLVLIENEIRRLKNGQYESERKNNVLRNRFKRLGSQVVQKNLQRREKRFAKAMILNKRQLEIYSPALMVRLKLEIQTLHLETNRDGGVAGVNSIE